MHCSDYYAVIYDGGVFCVGCVPEGVDVDGIDADGNSICTPIFACSEWEYYPVCEVCHAIHDYVTLLEYDKR